MKYLILLLLLVGCATEPHYYHPRFKAGQCLVQINNPAQKWMVIRVKNYSYVFRNYYNPNRVIQINSYLDNQYQPIPCYGERNE